MSGLRTFSDLLNSMQGGIDPGQLSKGVKVVLSAEEAIGLFGVDMVRKDLGSVVIRITWRFDGDKPVEAELFITSRS